MRVRGLQAQGALPVGEGGSHASGPYAHHRSHLQPEKHPGAGLASLELSQRTAMPTHTT
jgi:hypothetical protein